MGLALIPLLVQLAHADTPGAAGDGASAESGVADRLWEQRADEENLVKALTAYEVVLQTKPYDRHALEMLARGWYFYGDAWTDDADKKLDRWSKAVDYGNRCLALNTTYNG